MNDIKRDYKITKSPLWFNVYREREEDWLQIMEWLQNWTYTLNRNHAKTFYHISDAESALIIARCNQWKTDTTSKEIKSETKAEKQSWSEF